MPRILIVSRNPELMEATRAYLGRGAQVVLESDWQTALRLATRMQPGLILLDVSGTGADGFELARLLWLRTKATVLFLDGSRVDVRPVLEPVLDSLASRPAPSGWAPVPHDDLAAHKHQTLRRPLPADLVRRATRRVG